MVIGFRAGSLILACLLTACSGGGSGDLRTDIMPIVSGPVELEALPRDDIRGTERLYPYRADSPYASVLKDCALVKIAENACTLAVLPFIAQATPNFTRDDILNRLLVTHDWMGKRFEQLLDDTPEKMVTLYGSLTSIVIGSTVRPSNYWIGTGGIKLDPESLWLSVEEKANVSLEEDFRNAYGKELQFWTFGALRKGNEAAVNYYSLTSMVERTLTAIKLPMYRLLYHELAHAVDYLPSSTIATLDYSLTPSAALAVNEQYWLSTQLYQNQPLYASELFGLAQVSYRGLGATEAQRSYLPSHVGSLMANDGAVKLYSYYTQREDFATLFETAMIKQDFDVDVYIAFVQKPANEEQYECSELTVGWGIRNRIADVLVKPRAKWVVESIYGPGLNIEELFASALGQSTLMTEGLDWCSNRDGQAHTVANRAQGANKRGAEPSERARLENERLDYAH